MMVRTKIIALVAIISFLISGLAPNATAATLNKSHDGMIVNDITNQYTNAEILQLLFDGTGRVADENPELLMRMNFAQQRPDTNQKILAEVIDVYLDYHTTFEEEVLRPLTSGNPYLVETALSRLTEMYFKMLKDVYGVTSLPAVAPSGCGAGAKVCVIAYAVVFLNAAVYANAAVATLAVVGIAVVPAAVSYLMSDENVDGEIVKTELIAALTNALAS